jgi:hypothetical protein
VPLVLWLFTRAPLGVLPSLLLGIVLMASHRLYARPFALARAGRRCLWCGGATTRPLPIEVREPFGETAWSACSEDHAGRIAGLLSWAAAHARFLKLGILGTLALFLAAGLGLGAGAPLGQWTFPDLSALFRLGIALTVLPLGWLGARRRAHPESALISPFPLHVQALIGSLAVLWLFRVVGLAWLALSLVELLRP